MASRHEKQKPKIFELHFKPEGYSSSESDEFLDEFLDKLKQVGLEPGALVFSGFDGTSIAKGEEMPRHLFIYAMDEVGWRDANRRTVENPATYAEGWDTPCVAVYDKSQLAEAYASDFYQDPDDFNSRIELKNVIVGKNLAELSPDTPVEEAVVHKDYPGASPADALLGLVFLDEI